MHPVDLAKPAMTARSDADSVRSVTDLAFTLARQWWPQVAALAAACAVVAATIVGAAGAGSAVDRGLLALAGARLGRIEAALTAEHGVSPLLLESLEALAREGDPFAIVPAFIGEVTVESAAGGRGDAARPATRATLLACDDPAALGFTPAPPPLGDAGMLVNQPLAAALGVAAGDTVVVRIPRLSAVPSDSPLGRREGESVGRRLAIAAVLPPDGLGRFSLRPTQVTAPLVVTSLASVAAMLRRDPPGLAAANIVLVASATGGSPREATARSAAAEVAAGEAVAARLRRVRPGALADLGLDLAPAPDGTGALRLTSRRLVLPPEADRAAAEVFAAMPGSTAKPATGNTAEPSLVFLANAIRPVDDTGPSATVAAAVPYSTVVGIDATELPVGNLVAADGMSLPLPGPDEIILDAWTVADLAAQGRPVAVGDRIRLEFFAPETLDGRVTETTATFRLAGIAALSGAAVARDFVPEVEGVTDERSIADWDPPFPFDAARVRTTPPHDEDDRYWKDYGAAPKAFLALETARQLAGSRFGRTTAWLVATDDQEDGRQAGTLGGRLLAAVDAARLGLRVEPLRADAARAARGSTPFGSLFLALSAFIVAAGLLLLWLLFSLLVAARRRDVALLAAVGWPPRRLAGLLLVVGGSAAVAGVAAGTLLGPWWTRGLLAMLARSWDTNVKAGGATPLVLAAPAAADLWPAAVAALVIAVAAVWWAASRAARLPPRALLAGGDMATGLPRRASRFTLPLAGGLLLAAAVTAAAGRGGDAATAAGFFFAAGGLALAGLLLLVRRWLTATATRRPLSSLAGLARRGLAHASGRAFAVAAIVALAEFLLVAVSAFTLRPPADPTDRQSATGGWTFLATLGASTAVDPADPEARAGLGLSAADEKLLGECTIVRLRSSGGDDAACTNLYASLRPTVLGVGRSFIDRGGFAFTDHADLPVSGPAGSRVSGPAQSRGENPWRLLEPDPVDEPLLDTAAIPAILDQATAQWALGLGGIGSRFQLPDAAGRPVTLELVGLLDGSVLQGFVLVGDRGFRRMFPDVSGYAAAFIDAWSLPPGDRDRVPAAIATAWADAAPAVEATTARLASLQAVQNTFLAGFQLLGGLGLLLGTAGVAAVQAQGVVERLGSLSLLRAVGFRLGRLRSMLVMETLLTVGLGLAAGVAAGGLAVAPAAAAPGAGFLRAALGKLPLGWIAVTSGLSLAVAVVASLAAASRQTIPERPRRD
jgi:putative ABC transport system permease protein